MTNRHYPLRVTNPNSLVTTPEFTQAWNLQVRKVNTWRQTHIASTCRACHQEFLHQRFDRVPEECPWCTFTEALGTKGTGWCPVASYGHNVTVSFHRVKQHYPHQNDRLYARYKLPIPRHHPEWVAPAWFLVMLSLGWTYRPKRSRDVLFMVGKEDHQRAFLQLYDQNKEAARTYLYYVLQGIRPTK